MTNYFFDNHKGMQKIRCSTIFNRLNYNLYEKKTVIHRIFALKTNFLNTF